LFGAAGLFGKWISAHPVVIVFVRAAVAALAFLVILRWRRDDAPRSLGADWLLLPFTGCVLAGHWLAFFLAVRVSTVAVALLSYSTAPVFAAVLEPPVFRERFSPRALGAALVTMAGVAFIVPRWTAADATVGGVFWGVLSGAGFALLSLLNRALVRRHAPMRLALYQDGVAALVLLPWLPGAWTPLAARDVALLVAMGLACTALAHALFIATLRRLPVRTAALAGALEPVYGILLAVLLLGEVPAWRSIAGGVLIMAAVLWVTVARPVENHPPRLTEREGRTVTVETACRRA
jgi:drug/metabolite transporter (DMT)-like permease